MRHLEEIIRVNKKAMKRSDKGKGPYNVPIDKQVRGTYVKSKGPSDTPTYVRGK